jgi:hypothetical protein
MCNFKTLGCNASTPCRRCREVSSRRNTASAGYRIRTDAEGGNYWTRRR